MLAEFGVDLTIWGHEHSHQRTWPVYNHLVMNGTTSGPYHNPGTVVHITAASAVRGIARRCTRVTERGGHYISVYGVSYSVHGYSM